MDLLTQNDAPCAASILPETTALNPMDAIIGRRVKNETASTGFKRKSMSEINNLFA